MPGVASSSLVSAWRKMRSEKKKDPYGLRGEYGGGTDAVKSLQEFVKGGSTELAKDPFVRARMNEANSTVLEGARRGAEDYSRTTGEGAGSSGGAAQRTLALTLGSSAGSSAANSVLASERDQKLRSLAALADTETTRLGMELGSESEFRQLDEMRRRENKAGAGRKELADALTGEPGWDISPGQYGNRHTDWVKRVAGIRAKYGMGV